MELPIDIIIRVDAKKENDSGEYTFQCKALGELVRCGECERIEPDEEPQNGGKKYVWCKYWRVWKPEDGFCDVGRPKGENA